MKRRGSVVAVVCVLLSAFALPLAAEEASEPVAAAYQRNLAFVGDRAVQLAEAIPAEAYGWRPMDGVRSVSEAIMHMAGANYFFAGRLGAAPPEGVDVQGLEQITAKEECVAALQKSIQHMDAALAGVPDLQAATELFGRDATVEDLLLIAIGHVHEHFGQLIAYARANRVVPPWSRQ